MNSTAKACWGWAAGLFVAALLTLGFQSEIYEAAIDVAGGDSYTPVEWVLALVSTFTYGALATAGALIAAGVVIQKLAPVRPAPLAPVDGSRGPAA